MSHMQMPIIFVYFRFNDFIYTNDVVVVVINIGVVAGFRFFAVSPFKHSTAISNKLDQFKIHRNLTFLSRTTHSTLFNRNRKKESKTWPHIESAWMAEIAYRRFLISRLKYFFRFFSSSTFKKKTVQQHSCIWLNLELRTDIHTRS